MRELVLELKSSTQGHLRAHLWPLPIKMNVHSELCCLLIKRTYITERLYLFLHTSAASKTVTYRRGIDGVCVANWPLTVPVQGPARSPRSLMGVRCNSAPQSSTQIWNMSSAADNKVKSARRDEFPSGDFRISKTLPLLWNKNTRAICFVFVFFVLFFPPTLLVLLPGFLQRGRKVKLNW